MPKLTADKLANWYDEAERADREIFAEQRSNVLLIAGEHYQRRTQKTSSRLRNNPELEQQKLRLVKNHTHKVFRYYTSSILSQSPGTTVLPQKDTELQDQKLAEMNLAVWQDMKYRYRMREKVRAWCHDYVGLGEVAVKVFFDPNQGKLVGYGPMQTPDGEPMLDDFGQPVQDPENPQFEGKFVYERIYAFNLLRAGWSKSIADSPWLCIRKLTERSHLLSVYTSEEQKKMLTEANEDDFIVFDADKGRYSREEKQVLVREFYWRPCREYPNGWYAISTKEGILEEGELPFGIFPIVWAGFDEHPTAARARSIIKVVRPFQAEINRASSQMAMHQITVGDDKLIYQSGTKLASGSLLPGVRGVTYQGAAPTILPGRDGSQFLGYMQAQVSELYDCVMMEEMNEEKPTGSVEPFTLLFRSLRQQQKFSEYGEKFEQFLIDITELSLQLAKIYMSDEELLVALGKREQGNAAQFRDSTPLNFSIKIEAQSETIEETLGRQLTLNHILQYTSNKLERDDIGKILRAMPYGNFEEAFDDFTIDQDSVKNDMLAIERGGDARISQYDNHEYAVKRIAKRMKEADFEYLPPQIQQKYEALYVSHRQFLEQQAEALAAAKNEYIPTGGAMITADMYVPSEEKNTDGSPKPDKRVRLPYQALDWLVNTLEKQGMGLEKLEEQNKQTISEMSQQIAQRNGAAGGQQQPPMPPQPGYRPGLGVAR